jgi:hypothetical protein
MPAPVSDSLPLAPPAGAAPSSPWPSLLRLWGLALLLSALLVAAGRHWPQPLVPAPRAVWALVFGPPLLMVLRLLLGDRGESGR